MSHPSKPHSLARVEALLRAYAEARVALEAELAQLEHDAGPHPLADTIRRALNPDSATSEASALLKACQTHTANTHAADKDGYLADRSSSPSPSPFYAPVLVKSEQPEDLHVPRAERHSTPMIKFVSTARTHLLTGRNLWHPRVPRVYPRPEADADDWRRSPSNSVGSESPLVAVVKRRNLKRTRGAVGEEEDDDQSEAHSTSDDDAAPRSAKLRRTLFAAPSAVPPPPAAPSARGRGRRSAPCPAPVFLRRSARLSGALLPPPPPSAVSASSQPLPNAPTRQSSGSILILARPVNPPSDSSATPASPPEVVRRTSFPVTFISKSLRRSTRLADKL